MQVTGKPSPLTVIAAQLAAYLLAVVLCGVLYFSALVALGAARLRWPEMPGWAVSLLVAAGLVIAGVLLAALQRSLLRRCLPGRAGWLVLGGLALAVVAVLDWQLLSRFFIPPPAFGRYLGDYADWQAAVRQVSRWSMAAGFAAGLPAGLLFGAAQSLLLPWRRRLWWALSALAWGILAALTLYLVNASAILLAGMD